MNQISYTTENGYVRGDFNIYQGKNGAIYLLMGKSYTELTEKQIQELHINCYDLLDFDIDLFNKLYRRTPIAYRVLENCTAGFFGRNYEEGEELIIAEEEDGNNWEGTEWYDKLPGLFQPIYEEAELSAPIADDEEEGEVSNG